MIGLFLDQQVDKPERLKHKIERHKNEAWGLHQAKLQKLNCDWFWFCEFNSSPSEFGATETTNLDSNSPKPSNSKVGSTQSSAKEAAAPRSRFDWRFKWGGRMWSRANWRRIPVPPLSLQHQENISSWEAFGLNARPWRHVSLLWMWFHLQVNCKLKIHLPYNVKFYYFIRWNRDYFMHMKSHYEGPPYRCTSCKETYFGSIFFPKAWWLSR
jgi:hypothetical protein